MSVEVKALVAPPKRVDDLLDLLLGAVRGAAAGHDVLQHVAQAGPEVLALVGAAGVLHEAPHRGHRRHVVLLHDHRQPVGERGQRDVVGQAADAGVAGRFNLGRRLRRCSPKKHGRGRRKCENRCRQPLHALGHEECSVKGPFGREAAIVPRFSVLE